MWLTWIRPNSIRTFNCAFLELISEDNNSIVPRAFAAACIGFPADQIILGRCLDGPLMKQRQHHLLYKIGSVLVLLSMYSGPQRVKVSRGGHGKDCVTSGLTYYQR